MPPLRPMPELRRFLAYCTAALVAMIVGLTIIVSVIDLGLSIDGLVALYLGSIVTMILAMALMALLFASSRTGHDDDAQPGNLADDSSR